MCLKRSLTRAEGLHVEVFGDAAADFFSLLHQEPVHGGDGRHHVVGRQVKGRRLLARPLLWTEKRSVHFVTETGAPSGHVFRFHPRYDDITH